MSVTSFKEARNHVGHKIECVIYGNEEVSVECVDCYEVIVSYVNFERKEQGVNRKRGINYGARHLRNVGIPESDAKKKKE